MSTATDSKLISAVNALGGLEGPTIAQLMAKFPSVMDACRAQAKAVTEAHTEWSAKQDELIGACAEQNVPAQALDSADAITKYGLGVGPLYELNIQVKRLAQLRNDGLRTLYADAIHQIGLDDTVSEIADALRELGAALAESAATTMQLRDEVIALEKLAASNADVRDRIKRAGVGNTVRSGVLESPEVIADRARKVADHLEQS